MANTIPRFLLLLNFILLYLMLVNMSDKKTRRRVLESEGISEEITRNFNSDPADNSSSLNKDLNKNQDMN
jgi:hypothetical protein